MLVTSLGSAQGLDELCSGFAHATIVASSVGWAVQPSWHECDKLADDVVDWTYCSCVSAAFRKRREAPFYASVARA